MAVCPNRPLKLGDCPETSTVHRLKRAAVSSADMPPGRRPSLTGVLLRRLFQPSSLTRALECTIPMLGPTVYPDAVRDFSLAAADSAGALKCKLQVLKAADQRVVCPSHTPWLSPWSLSETVFISFECTRQQMSKQSTESARPHLKATSSPKQALKSGHVCACCPTLALGSPYSTRSFPVSARGQR